ncbi:hypothetical protein KFV05_09200 [Macrococcoides canis]|uniref:type VII secretion EssA family protein n=1 Tax=Macrococcoides canis TaxID=1855823 RepID=UPI0020B848BF|nr:type VII secretion EssA family protein [Macrococcus canis]UTG99577.1 hypothetical protein KFV04_08715 [Macrococcus canis]UTH01887.1 hypothetical protein KFV05_09200 [Macrococcus canis]
MFKGLLMALMLQSTLHIDIDEGNTQQKRQEVDINQHGIDIFTEDTETTQKLMETRKQQEDKAVKQSIFSEKQIEDVNQSKQLLFTDEETYVDRPGSIMQEDDSPLLMWGVIVIFTGFIIYCINHFMRRRKHEESY